MAEENFIEMKRRLLEEGKISMNYEVSDPIKNEGFFWRPEYSLLQRQSFSDTAQMLGYFSKHSEYLGYADTEPEDLHIVLGLTSMSPMSEDTFLYGEDEKELLKCQIPQGIQTSLIRAFRAKSETFPIREEDKKFIDEIRDGVALSLFRASHLLPYVKDYTDIGLYAVTFFPALFDTSEKSREYWEKVARARDDCSRQREPDKEYVERWIDSMNLWRSEKRVPTRTLENLAEQSLSFVSEFAPEVYEQFRKAIQK